jgi:hypothetical protein
MLFGNYNVDAQIDSLIKLAYFMWTCKTYLGKRNQMKMPIEVSHASMLDQSIAAHTAREKGTKKFDSMCSSIESHGCFADEFEMKQKMRAAYKQAGSLSSPVVTDTTRTLEQSRIRNAIIITEE